MAEAILGYEEVLIVDAAPFLPRGNSRFFLFTPTLTHRGGGRGVPPPLVGGG